MLQIRTSRLNAFAAWGLIALGGVLRLRQYLVNRSLWLDEAMLALNIIERDFRGLLKPLDHEQGAPLGFLQLEKLAATLFGNGELSLRLLPLLAGCASLVLFYLLIRRMLAPAGTLTALALFAISPTLVYYSSEVKQYSFDVFIALLLLLLAFRAQLSLSVAGDPSPVTRYLLPVFGALALWFSHPALFILAAIGAVTLLDNIIQRNRAGILSTLAMGAGWLVSFGALYFVSLRQLSGNEFLLGYWDDYFLPHPLDVGWMLNAMQALFRNPGGVEGFPSIVFLLIAACGALALFARQKKVTGSLLLVFVFALAASSVRKYPFAGRMMLFSVPLLFLFLGAAADWLSGLKLRPRFLAPLMAFALAGFLLYNPVLASTERFFAPKTPDNIRPAIEFLQQNRKPGDMIYVSYWALPAFRYYAPRFGFSESDFIAGNLYEDTPQALLDEIDGLKGQKRVWILFSHIYENGAYNERDFVLAHLDEIGEQKRDFRATGTNLYLYNLEK
jgi:hypothetical protein